MKKLVLSLLVLCSGITTLRATHLMGGQITSANIGGLTYEVTFTAYRDTMGIPMDPSATIFYSDSSGFSAIHIVAYQPAVNIGNGVEMYKYIDTITFPASGNYHIYWESCCRNVAIINLFPNGGAYGFYLQNDLYADSSNSSPVFLNIPITVAQLNVPFSYNPLPYDSDGDSIAWVLDLPLDNTGLPITAYALPPSDTLAPFTLDPLTGEITFLPNTLGNFVVSFTVQEFRNGVQIGSIRRDMQILVMPSVNQPLRLNVNSTSAPYSGKKYDIVPNTPFTLTLVAEDPDMSAPALEASGEVFLISNPASFSTTANGAFTYGTLTWNPGTAEARPAPYLVGLRANDVYTVNTFSTDVTIALRVGNFTGVHELNSAAGLSVYPNPSAGDKLTLTFTLEDTSPVSIEFLSLSGQRVKYLENVAKMNGLHQVEMADPGLAKGMYLVRLIQNGKTLESTKITIQ